MNLTEKCYTRKKVIISQTIIIIRFAANLEAMKKVGLLVGLDHIYLNNIESSRKML